MPRKDYITTSELKRLCYVAGVPSVRSKAYSEISRWTKRLMEKLLLLALTHTKHARRKTVKVEDIIEAAKNLNATTAGLLDPVDKRCKIVSRKNVMNRIRYYQKQSECLHISKASFAKMIRHIGQDYKNDLRFEKDAILATQMVAEEFVINLAQDSILVTIAAKRKTLQDVDVKTAVSILKLDKKL